ncbi:hypothetical protein [Plantibacter sp. RU18]|uniref:hypothetical protein n=1 Tax=Plantibacter sp. RU18 TaxID=3158143 RepID=UPI003D364868
MTAKEAAKRFGISERHVRNIAAEPRAEFERRAFERGEQILAWRAEGVLWRDIAERLGISLNAAQKAGGLAVKRRANRDG